MPHSTSWVLSPSYHNWDFLTAYLSNIYSLKGGFEDPNKALPHLLLFHVCISGPHAAVGLYLENVLDEQLYIRLAKISCIYIKVLFLLPFPLLIFVFALCLLFVWGSYTVCGFIPNSALRDYFSGAQGTICSEEEMNLVELPTKQTLPPYKINQSCTIV